MTCEINLEGLYKMVKKRLDTAEGLIDSKTVATAIYDKIYEGVMKNTNDPEGARDQAMAYARMVPTMIRTGLMSDADLFMKATQTGFDFPALAKMEQDFKTDIKNVYQSVVTAAQTVVQDLGNLQERIEEQKEEEKANEVESVFQTEIEQQYGTFGKYPPTFFASTGAEWTSGESWKYILQRKILRLVNQESDYRRNGIYINLPGVGPVTLRLKPTVNIPENQLDRSINTKKQAVVAYKPKPEDVAYVLVDTAGNELYFDPLTGDISSEDKGGRLAYWSVYKPENFIEKTKEGGMKMKAFVLGTAKSDSEKESKKVYQNIAEHLSQRQFGLSYFSLDKQQKQAVDQALENQLMLIQAAHDAALDGKDIEFDIVGGTLGYVSEDARDLKRKVSLMNLPFITRENFQIQVFNVKGSTYSAFMHDGQPVRIKVTPGIREDFAETITSLLVDDEVLNNDGTKATDEQRSEMIRRMVNPGELEVEKPTGGKAYFRFNNSKLKVAKGKSGKTHIWLIPKNAPGGKWNYNAEVVNISDNPNARAMIKDYLMNTEFMHIDQKYTKHPNRFAYPVMETIDTGERVIREIAVNYNDFIRENEVFHITANQDPTGDMVRRDSYFTLSINEMDAKYLMGMNPDKTITEQAEQIVDGNEEIKEEVQPVQEEKPNESNIQTPEGYDDFMNSPDTVWDKLQMQKTGNVEATREQVMAAKAWYEKSPLKQYFPFEVMFNAVNGRNPSSVAEWTIDGIVLYKGSDFTDLYHEAWHGFSQTFLNPKQRKGMYRELSKKSGGFKDYNGKYVQFMAASEKQLEEYLAEAFREFMLSNGQKVDSQTPKTNNIFKKILNFLKELFGGTSYKDGISNPRITKTVDELFQKLRIGNISEFTFDANNRGFGVLFSSMQSTDENEATREKRSYQDTTLIMESIDSVFSMVMDDLNKGALAKGTKRFSNTLFKSNRNKLNAYTAAFLKFKEIAEELKKQVDAASGDQKNLLQYRLDLVNWTIRNFGDLKSIETNVKMGRGVIYAHLQKSRILSNEDKEAAMNSDELDESDVYKKNKGQNFDRSGQDMSLKEMASKEILYILRGLYKYDEKGNVETNVLGLPKLNDFDKTWNYIARNLEGTLQADVMFDKLKELNGPKNVDKDHRALVGQLLGKFNGVASLDYHDNHLWTNFWQTFNKTRVPLIQMTLKASEGETYTQVNYEITVGEAQSSSNQIIQNWENSFATNVTNFIKEKKIDIQRGGRRFETEHYLDIPAVLAKYDSWAQLKDSPNKLYEFLNDIGIKLSYRAPILSALQNDLSIKQTVNHIYSTLKYLEENRHEFPDPIRSVRDIFETYDQREHAFNRLNDLKELESKYGDVVSSFMVSNAEGNAQFEHSLNSSLTVMVEAINKAKSFDELIKMPYMAHLDPKRNPMIQSSIWLKSIFMPKADGSLGVKRRDSDNQPVVIKLENLSGVKTIDQYGNEEGIASASSDPLTKFILDFHTNILRGSPELPRHADKGTSYSTYVSDIVTDDMNKISRFKYIDDADFFMNKNGTAIVDNEFSETMGFENMVSLIVPYVGSELKRIEEMKRLEGLKDLDYDFKYMKAGQKFAIFDDVFSADLKKRLIAEGSENYKKLMPEIRKAFENYFTNLNDENLKIQNRASYVDSNVVKAINKQIRRKLKADKRYRVTNDNFRKGAMMSFTVNSWIHNLESLTMIYGDLAQYNHKKEEFHKRNAGVASTGQIYRTDRFAVTYANSIGRRFGKKAIGYEKEMSYDGTFDTAVMEDTTAEAEYIGQYSDAIRSYFRKRYKDQAVADAKAKKVIEKYTKKETKEGDGQGWISFDSYRIMMTLQGTWTEDQEEMYRKVVTGEVVDTEQVLQFFPVKKVQYWGPLQTSDGPPVMGMHKFSLVPLIPNVIQGTNLQLLHERMMREGIDYALFRSGSKIGTITRNGEKADSFYSNENTRTFNSTGGFVKNTVFLNFLKDQVDTGNEFKKKVTIPTQMRKLLIDGYSEIGVPVDFEPSLSDEQRIAKWEALDEDEKQISDYYKKYKNYEKQVDALTKKKYQELLKKIDFKEVDGKPTGNIRNLVNYIRSQFELQDLSDHEKAFIEESSEGGLKNDLSLSFSADKIEKLLNAIVVKELVKQKMKGEGLIQVSTAGWEKVGTSRELSTYHIKDGVVQPMEIKIALQGDFLKLLNLPDVKQYVQQGMSELEALNTLINDEVWLSKGNNRRMVMMTATRIPVQGHNSMEFMRVKEFLPTNAGHMIVVPSEIVSKSGSDFDIDKLFTMMPSIKSDKEKGAEYDTESQENKLIESQMDLISDIDNFVNLIRPNATDIFDDLAQDLKPDVSEYDPMKNQNEDSTREGVSPTRVLELGYNLYKQNTNSVGKAVLGIGAVENTFNVLFNRIGMYMNPTNGLTLAEYYKLRDFVLANKPKRVKPSLKTKINGVEKKYTFKEIEKVVKDFGRQVIAMPHNSRKVDGQNVISISNMYDANNENRISDIISQMINGWVDVAKDTWIFNVQGNKEISPTLLYLIQAGVPVDQAVYFVSQPLVRQYVDNLRSNKSVVAGPLGKKPSQPNLVAYNAKKEILIKQVGVKSITTVKKDREGNEVSSVWYDKIDTFKKTQDLVDPYMEKGFDKTEMRKRIKNYNESLKKGEEYVADDFDKAAFLHFLEVEEQAKALTAFKRTTNVDTSKQSTLFDARKKQLAIAELSKNGRIPVEMVDRIKERTAIGSFFDVLQYQQDVWGPYFKIRDNEQLNDMLTEAISQSDVVDETFGGDHEKFANDFRNDFMVFLLQKDMYSFDLKNLKSYKGYETDISTPVKDVDFLEFGAFFKDGVAYVDKRQLSKDYNNLGSVQKQVVAPVKKTMFTSPEEYYKFVMEREFLRSRYPLEVLKDTIFYKEKLALNELKHKNESERMQNIITYEETLADMALTNNYNLQHMFKSRDTMVHKLMTIMEKHPELKENYKVLEALGIQRVGNTFNIKMIDTVLDGDKVNLYHENMTDLSDPDKIMINADYLDKKFIADFFSKMSIYSIMQAGFNTGGKLSLQRIMNQDAYLREATRITKQYTRKNNPEKFDSKLLSEYYEKFVYGQNYRTNADKMRFKDYAKPVPKTRKKKGDAEQRAEEEAVMGASKGIMIDDAAGIVSYDVSKLSLDQVEKMVSDNPNILFVFDDVLEEPGSTMSQEEMSYGNSLRILVGRYDNVVGIPTRRTYKKMFSSAAIMDVDKDGKKEVSEGFKRKFQEAVREINNKLSENPEYVLAFKVNGHGQKQINADDNNPGSIIGKQTAGLQTFKYISEQLYSNFGFRNPNHMERMEDARTYVKETQPITDEMVIEQLKFCYGLT